MHLENHNSKTIRCSHYPMMLCFRTRAFTTRVRCSVCQPLFKVRNTAAVFGSPIVSSPRPPRVILKTFNRGSCPFKTLTRRKLEIVLSFRFAKKDRIITKAKLISLNKGLCIILPNYWLLHLNPENMSMLIQSASSLLTYSPIASATRQPLVFPRSSYTNLMVACASHTTAGPYYVRKTNHERSRLTRTMPILCNCDP